MGNVSVRRVSSVVLRKVARGVLGKAAQGAGKKFSEHRGWQCAEAGVNRQSWVDLYDKKR